jgi:hypothetical protein
MDGRVHFGLPYWRVGQHGERVASIAAPLFSGRCDLVVGDWKKAALPLSRFREFPGTLAGIVGIVALIPTYDRPMHAEIVALGPEPE